MQDQKIIMPARMIPDFNVSRALANKVHENILIETWGGLGDVICAEPAIRFALRNFKGRKISLATHFPEVFAHLQDKLFNVFDLRIERPDTSQYFTVKTVQNPSHLSWQFMSHMLTHPVQHCAMSVFRGFLSPYDSVINLPYQKSHYTDLVAEKVVIHAGKHWKSKTFPRAWWDELLTLLENEGIDYVMVGQKVDENIGYVDFPGREFEHDLRDQLSMSEFLSVAQAAHTVISNDSAIIHAASAGAARIFFAATVKAPWLLMHYRYNEIGKVCHPGEFRTWHFEKTGVWDDLDVCPVVNSEITIEDLPEGMTYQDILPSPTDLIELIAKSL